MNFHLHAYPGDKPKSIIFVSCFTVSFRFKVQLRDKIDESVLPAFELLLVSIPVGITPAYKVCCGFSFVCISICLLIHLSVNIVLKFDLLHGGTFQDYRSSAHLL